MTAAPARLLLSGYYGFGNFGDEAILRVFVDEWRRRRADDVIAVLSERPEETRRTYGVEALPRMAWGGVRAAVRHADVTVSGGGGLLQSGTSLRSLLYYAGIIRDAKRGGRKAAIFAQGIGPLNLFGREVIRRACAQVDLACVRDEESANALAALLPHVDVKLAADPVFLAPIAKDPAAEIALEHEGVHGDIKTLVAVVVRRGAVLDQMMERLAGIVDRLTSYGAHVVFVPLQIPHDAEAASSVIRRCKSTPVLLGGGYDLPAMTTLIARCTAVISMRLHALIIAARLGVPFLAVPHDPKIGALAGTLNYPLPPLLRDSLVVETADALWSQRDALRAHLLARTPALQARATLAFDWLQALVEGAPSVKR
jgi:polysaccharide pyruvyl transferase CsaB